jgi:hypothetical protein
MFLLKTIQISCKFSLYHYVKACVQKFVKTHVIFKSFQEVMFFYLKTFITTIFKMFLRIFYWLNWIKFPKYVYQNNIIENNIV